MVSPLALLPLLVALVLVSLIVVAGTSAGANRHFKRIARVLFGRFVDESHLERKRLLQSAYVAETYNVYAAKSYLYAVLIAIAGGVIGAYVLGGLVLAVPLIGDLVAGLPNTMTAALGQPSTWSVELSDSGWLVLMIGGGLVSGILSGVVSYSLRWRLLAGRAEARRRRINESLPRTVAFLYAQSRGGMAFPAIMRTLATNRNVYGETAAEISVAAREMDLFGTDMISAIKRMAHRTPSEDFKTFSENLSSVLQSGQNLPSFLHDQYERYQEEAEERQEEILELLATMAEAYVTVLVAGTLFLITVLLVFGLTTTSTLGILQLLGYLAIPLANLGFMVFLNQRLELLGIGNESDASALDETELLADTDVSARDLQATDGGTTPTLADNLERLELYDRLERIQRIIRRPLQVVFWNPTSILYVTVPLALCVTVVRLPTAFTGIGINVRALDDIVIQALLFVLGTYALVRFVYKRRINRIESASPEFLERLASLNEAGMSVVESFDRVRGSDLGALSEELERIWADITLGANVEDALVRFGRRVQTTPITRAVTLLSNAMRASGNIGRVLRIAATQARADLRMKRQRRRQMLTYLVVIYVSFLVFLVIIIAVQEVLVPSLPDSVPTPDSNNRLGVNADQITRFGEVNKAAYTLVFFHTALIQGLLSGLIGGQIGEGTVRDGVKHAFVLLGVAYVAFILLSSPVASIQFEQQFGGETVTVDSVSLSDGGYVVLHLYTPTGDVIGRSQYLEPGTHDDVEIRVNRELPDDVTVVAVPHLDTNDNQQFDYAGGETDRIYPPRIEAVKAEAEIQ
ncbi:type II secretion system F family protein [Halorientalis brevis]|uniref:Type II secretion system F family protein n=1 Tax=Halorientalis brevis TaxID=1126241 RepID=A0ABD6CEF3_9EURY|nr:type II secretion system F family protein [Halorientalis brevis]